MRRVMSLIKAIGRQRGAERESTVDMALAEMKDRDEIVYFYKTDDRTDMSGGIDFVVIGIEGGKTPLQVKSSLTGALKHRKKFPDIPVIVIGVEDIESVKNKIRNLL